MKIIKGRYGRYAHYYNGEFNSRGKRTLSKIHKGLNGSNLDDIYKKIEQERSNGK